MFCFPMLYTCQHLLKSYPRFCTGKTWPLMPLFLLIPCPTVYVNNPSVIQLNTTIYGRLIEHVIKHIQLKKMIMLRTPNIIFLTMTKSSLYMQVSSTLHPKQLICNTREIQSHKIMKKMKKMQKCLFIRYRNALEKWDQTGFENRPSIKNKYAASWSSIDRYAQ